MCQILERDIAETFAAECFWTAEIYEQRENLRQQIDYLGFFHGILCMKNGSLRSDSIL